MEQVTIRKEKIQRTAFCWEYASAIEEWGRTLANESGTIVSILRKGPRLLEMGTREALIPPSVLDRVVSERGIIGDFPSLAKGELIILSDDAIIVGSTFARLADALGDLFGQQNVRGYPFVISDSAMKESLSMVEYAENKIPMGQVTSFVNSEIAAFGILDKPYDIEHPVIYLDISGELSAQGLERVLSKWAQRTNAGIYATPRPIALSGGGTDVRSVWSILPFADEAERRPCPLRKVRCYYAHEEKRLAVVPICPRIATIEGLGDEAQALQNELSACWRTFMGRVQLADATERRELLKLQKRALVTWANYLIEVASLKSVIQGIRREFLENGLASASAKYYLDPFDLQLLVGRVLAKEVKGHIEEYLELDGCGIEAHSRSDEWRDLRPVVPKEYEGSYLVALSDLTEGATHAEEVVAAVFKAQHVGIELASREGNPLDPNRLEFGVSLDYIEELVRQKVGSVDTVDLHKALDEQIDGGSVVPRYLWQTVHEKEVWYRSFRIGEGQSMVRAHVTVECFKALNAVKRSQFLREVLTEKFIVLACEFCGLFRDPSLVAAPRIYRGFHLYGARPEVVVGGRREWLIDWGQRRRILTRARSNRTFTYALHPKYKDYFKSEESPLTEPMQFRLAALARWTAAAEKRLPPDFLTCITTVESKWAYKMALMAELRGWLHDGKMGLEAAMFALDDLVEQTSPERFQKADSALAKLGNWLAQARQKYLLRKRYSDYIAKANKCWPEDSYEDAAMTWCKLIRPKIRSLEDRDGEGIEDILEPTIHVTHCATTLLRNVLSEFSGEQHPKQRPISDCAQEVIEAIESLRLDIRTKFEPAISDMQAVMNIKDLRSVVAKVREAVQRIGDATDWVLEHLDLKGNFEKWKADPDEFLEENKDIEKKVRTITGGHSQVFQGPVMVQGDLNVGTEDRSVSAGRDIKNSTVATGDENEQEVRVGEGGEVDIVKELAAFRQAIEGLNLENALKRDVLCDVASAEDEVGSEGEDKSHIDDMVAGALKRIVKAGTVVSSVTALRDAGFAIAAWLSVHAEKLGPVLARMWPG